MKEGLEGKEPIWVNDDIRRKIKKRKEYNRKKRNAQDPVAAERYATLYQIQKKEAKDAVKKAKEKYECKITSEIKSDRDNRKLWEQINTLKGKVKSRSEITIYDEDGEELGKEKIQEETNKFWNSIYRKSSNNIQDIWNTEKRLEYRDRIQNQKSKAMIMLSNEDEYSFPVVLSEHMDMLGEVINNEELIIYEMQPMKFQKEHVKKHLSSIKNGKKLDQMD